MKDRMLLRRILLYGIGSVAIAALLYGGYFYEPAPNFQTLYGTLLSRLRENDQAGVDAALAQMRRHHGDHLKLPLVEGYLAEVAQDWKGAQECYRRAIKRCATAEQQADIMLSIADLHRRMNDIAAAEKGLSDAVALGGESERSRTFRIHLLIHKAKWEQALSELATLAEEHPESMRPIALRALIERERTAGQPLPPNSSND